MAKILLSWIGTKNDFSKDKPSEIDTKGPNMSVHEYFYKRHEYDYHILLTQHKTESGNTQFDRLVHSLRTNYPTHKIVPRAMALNDIIDFNEIYQKINTLLLELKHHEVDIFVSPGTPTMQVAWYFAHQSLGLNTRLFQLRNPKYTQNEQTDPIWIKIKQSAFTTSLTIQSQYDDYSDDEPDVHIAPILRPIYDKAKLIADAEKVSVLITGNSGTGKEGLAKYIHKQSPRQNGRIITLNCSALGDELLESRLFGHEKGAFTNAHTRTDGIFREAIGGTVFLDEIGDISPYMQQTLLRVIEEKTVMRVGSSKEETIDVRIIAATNKNLYDMVQKGTFREDLYYRLAVKELTLPSLSEYSFVEKETLFQFLWRKIHKELNKQKVNLPSSIRKLLLQYPYPGNIREMQNVIFSILAEAEHTVTLENIPKRIVQPQGKDSLLLDVIEKAHIQKVLHLCNGNVTEASKLLGVGMTSLRAKKKEWNME